MTVTLLSSPPDLSDVVVRHSQKNTVLLVKPLLAGSHEQIVGELLVCESQLYFYSHENNSGIAVEYKDIIIHAISRREGIPCIYCQLDEGIFFPQQQLPEDAQELEETVTELKFIPEDSEILETIYLVMSECASLHPDEEFMAEQEEEDMFYADPSDAAELNDVQQAALRHLESVFEPVAQQNGVKEGQFDNSMEE
ncbi:regulator of volume decrease after cellular swelling-domain-containing protein [Spinellus fusiger]|nr:regulator of volume decrease after cellular swelling-domain-containing protein [Spinellus fusiger]